jgi:hypothetical protein
MTMTDPTPPRDQIVPTTVLLVGHCTADTWMLRTTLGRILPDAVLRPVNDETSLNNQLTTTIGPVVMLVNRLLDGRFPYADGIRLLEHHSSSPAVGMLISNLADAQDSARGVGAVDGFGKTALNDDQTGLLLREADEAARKIHEAASHS